MFLLFFIVYGAVNLVRLLVRNGPVYENFLHPFTVDEHTVLLMHFDGGLDNRSPLSDDGMAQGRIRFSDGLPGLGQAVWIDNAHAGDSSMIIIPHSDDLNLKTSFTIEGWSKNLSFDQAGHGATVSRTPWIIRKGTTGGGHDFAYALTVNPFTRSFDATSVYTDWGPHVRIRNEQWNRLITPHHTINPDVWYHFTFIKDYDNHAKVLLVHDTNGDLYQWTGVLAPSDTTDYNDEHLFFGLCNTTRQREGIVYWNGFLDEVRISNTVRHYNVPPIIGHVTIDGGMQQPAPFQSVKLKAKVGTIGKNILKGLPVLYYHDGDEKWMKKKMQPDSEPGVFVSELPGKPKGTVLTYYIEASNDGGITGRYPQMRDEFGAIGFWNGREKTLDITFEEGPGGQPADYSHYAHTVGFSGNVSYSTDVPAALKGESKWSISVNMDQGYCCPDSSGLYIPSPTPFINGAYDGTGTGGWTIDFWFKIDPDFHFSEGLVGHQHAGMTLVYTGKWTSQMSGNLMQRIEALWDDTILMRFYTPFEHIRIRVPGLTSGKWLRAVIGEMEHAYFASFYDENNDMLVQDSWSKSTFREAYDPPFSLQSLIIGHSWGENNFRGWLDNIKWYNDARHP